MGALYQRPTPRRETGPAPPTSVYVGAAQPASGSAPIGDASVDGAGVFPLEQAVVVATALDESKPK